MTAGFLQRLTADAGGPRSPVPFLRPVLRGTSPVFDDDPLLWQPPGVPAEEAGSTATAPAPLPASGPLRDAGLPGPPDLGRLAGSRREAAEPRTLVDPPSAATPAAPITAPAPPRQAQTSYEPAAPIFERSRTPSSRQTGRPKQAVAPATSDRVEEPSPTRSTARPASIEAFQASIASKPAPSVQTPTTAEIVPHPASPREVPDARPAIPAGEPLEAPRQTRSPSHAPVAPALAPRPRDAAAALPLPEPPSAPAAGPTIEIGRLVVEVVRDAPESTAPPPAAPRTAAQASAIGPIGDLRAGLRRFPGWG